MIRYLNKDVYTGNFAAGLREGAGICVFASGETYSGLWSEDKPADKAASAPVDLFD